MTAHAALLIDNAWQYPPEDPRPILVQVGDGAVRLIIYGTDDTIALSRADWLALVAFVGDKLDPPTFTQSPTVQLLATVPQKRVKKSTDEASRRETRLDEAAVIARLRKLSPDGETMPTRAAYDAGRGSLPHSTTLDVRRKWREWAAVAGLSRQETAAKIADAHVERLQAKAQETAAEQPAAPFRANGSGM